MKTWWKRLLPLMLVAVVALIAACGDDSEDETTESAAAPSTAAPAESSAADTAAADTGGGGGTGDVKVVTDLPLQGASGAQSETLAQAMALYLEQQGGKAGGFTVDVRVERRLDRRQAAWDDHVLRQRPGLRWRREDRRRDGHLQLRLREDRGADPEPGQRRPWSRTPTPTAGLTKRPGHEAGEPEKYYPTGKRNYARVVTTDDYQGAAAAQLMQELGVKTVYVLNDNETYGKGVAKAFVVRRQEAGHRRCIANEAWDPKAPNYDALFERSSAKSPDGVYLGGIIDNNGGQLVKDKVKVLGDNDGRQADRPGRLTGTTCRPTSRPAAAEGMYLSFAGLDPDQLKEAVARPPSSSTPTGPSTASRRSTRSTARRRCRSSWRRSRSPTAPARASSTELLQGITIPADKSVIGKEIRIDRRPATPTRRTCRSTASRARRSVREDDRGRRRAPRGRRPARAGDLG